MIVETTTLSGTLSERIKGLMELRGLSKADLANETGVPVTTIGYLVDGSTYNPRIATLLAIANYLHVSLDQLVGPFCSKSQKALQGRDFQTEKSSDKKVPLLEWNDVIHWCKYGDDFLKDCAMKWVSAHQVVSMRAFALTVTYQAEGIFPRESIIIVDPQAECGFCGYVLAITRGGKLCINEVLYESDEVCLRSVGVSSSEEIPEDNRIIGKIVEQYAFFTQNLNLGSEDVSFKYST